MKKITKILLIINIASILLTYFYTFYKIIIGDGNEEVPTWFLNYSLTNVGLLVILSIFYLIRYGEV